MNRIFFKGLNELRGIAALAVLLHHVELFKHQDKIPGLLDTGLAGFVERLGKNGVYLFFVLSGFLITYLLLAEIKHHGTVYTARFYARRILRIWPLYYIVVGISFFVLPALVSVFPSMTDNFFGQRVLALDQNFNGSLLLFLLFLPNLALLLFTPVSGAAQSWSVGVEEQFYLLWPQLLRWCRNHVLFLLISVILVKFGTVYGLAMLNARVKHNAFTVAISFLKSFNIELMAVGGIGAYLLINGRLTRLIEVLPWWTRYGVLLCTLLLLFFPVSNLLLGVCFLGVILCNIHDRHALVRSRVFSFLGDISYGIYMYHPVVMFIVFSTVNHYLRGVHVVLYSVLVYTGVAGLTVLVSYLSYRYVESVFLRWKDRFVVIPSGEPVKHHG